MLTCEKNRSARLPYMTELKAKSTLKFNQQVLERVR